MKTKFAVAAVIASGLVIYTFLKKKYSNSASTIQYKKKAKHDKHQLTHAFANAKKHLVTQEEM